MRAVIILVINISSILLVIMIHNTVNEESGREIELKDALAVAMDQTMTEVMEQGSYGIRNRNELVAAFLQSMLQKVDRTTSLTVKIHKLDKERGTMDVEAVGEYMLPSQKKKRVSVRRLVAFTGA